MINLFGSASTAGKAPNITSQRPPSLLPLLLHHVQEPASLLSTTSQTRRVPALASRPGGGRLIITPTITSQQRQRLTQALLHLYSSNTAPPAAGAGGPPGATGAAPASAAAAAAAAAAAGGSGPSTAAHQRRVAPRLSAPVTGGCFTVTVLNMTGKVTFLSLHPDDTVLAMKQDLVDERQELTAPISDVAGLRLIFAGEILEDDRTLSECGIMNGSTVYLVKKSRGC